MEYQNTLTFKETEYFISVKAINDILSLNITNPKTQTSWVGSYTARQIEDLTTKSGNTKSFTIFCKLLTSALQNKNSSLHLDFYSYQDLESIRKGDSNLIKSFKPSKKKYLIISYVTDFEKIHYPLPVILQDISDKTNQVSRPGDNEITRLRQENAALIQSLSICKEEYLNYRERAERKIEELTSVKSELESEIQRMKEELDVIIFHLEDEAKKRNSSGKNDLKGLKVSLAKQIEENNYLKIELTKSKAIIEDLKKEEGSNRKMFEVFRKTEFDEDEELPIGSPQQTNFKFSSRDEDRNSQLKELHSQISFVQQLLQKNRT